MLSRLGAELELRRCGSSLGPSQYRLASTRRQTASSSNGDNLLLCGDKTGICVQATEIPALGRAAVGNQMLKGNTLLSASKV